jgi:hypothetical protein
MNIEIGTLRFNSVPAIRKRAGEARFRSSGEKALGNSRESGVL